MSSNLVFLAQDDSGSRFDQGLLGEASRVIGIDPASGLAVMALTEDPRSQAPRVACEILLDDMHANLASIARSEPVDEAPGLVCLRESLSNIDEHLREEGLGETSLAALQVDGASGRLCLAMAGSISGWLKSDQVHHLAASSPMPLAGEETVEPLLVELPAAGRQSLLLLPGRDEAAIGSDYVQLSLGRFPDAAEMLMRQLSMRAQREGMSHSPSLLFASVEATAEPARGLLGRWMKR